MHQKALEAGVLNNSSLHFLITINSLIVILRQFAANERYRLWCEKMSCDKDIPSIILYPSVRLQKNN